MIPNRARLRRSRTRTRVCAPQKAQKNAILGVLNERILTRLKEIAMHPNKIPMSRAARELDALLTARGMARGLAQGKREALLAVLNARGLSPTPVEQATIECCTDPDQLQRWIVKATAAASVSEVLAAEEPPARPRVRSPVTTRPHVGPTKRRAKRR